MKGDFLLLVSAMIWGFAFVAQSSANRYLGPYAFISIRFILGALFVLSYIAIKRNFKIRNRRSLIIGGVACGVVLFLGMALQQISLFTVSVGKAGFITGLYVVLVPVFGVFIRHKTSIETWIGVVLAVIGLYLLCLKGERFTLSSGEIFLLVSAVLWGIHVHLIGYFSPKTDSTKLAVVQFLVCAILSFVVSAFFEKNALSMINKSIFQILYTGILSTGVAWTIQIYVQKKAHPSHSALIMSMESVFAVIGGGLFFSEKMYYKEIIGCLLMLAGMIISRIRSDYGKK